MMDLLTQWAEENLSPPAPIHGYRSLDITPLYEWAVKNTVVLTQDDGWSHAYNRFFMGVCDYVSAIKQARREGFEEGRKEAARNLENMEESTDKIIHTTGLSCDAEWTRRYGSLIIPSRTLSRTFSISGA
jgi:hypothetical protein